MIKRNSGTQTAGLNPLHASQGTEATKPEATSESITGQTLNNSFGTTEIPNSPKSDQAFASMKTVAPGSQSLLSLALHGVNHLLDVDGRALFDLNPDTNTNEVSLNQVLARIPKTEQGQQAIQNLLQEFQTKTGQQLLASTIEGVLENPAQMTNLMAMSPKALAIGLKATSMWEKIEGTPTAIPEPTLKLPNKVDLAKLDQLGITRPEPEMKQIAPGLFSGEIKSDLSDSQANNNIAAASILDKLAANNHDIDGQKFQVDYNGQSFDTIDKLLGALHKDGHEIEVAVNQRIANFMDLKTQAPDGTFLEVPTPLFMKTGVKDKSGKEAITPAIHSALTIKIRKSSETKGPGFNADVNWFQGISGTGFFPVGLSRSSEWTGGTDRQLGSGEKAIKAAQLAGMFTDVVNQSAEKNNLWLGGYGATGVCNDSVAVIENILTGENRSYPLIMQDQFLMPELTKRLLEGGKQGYQQILNSIQILPNDAENPKSAARRAMLSIPSKSGSETFLSTIHARKTLSESIQ